MVWGSMKTCFCHLLAKACLLVFSWGVAPGSFAVLFTRLLTLWRPICFSLVFSSFGNQKKDAAFLIQPGFVCIECTITIAQTHFGFSIFSFGFFFLTFSLEWMNKWIKNKHKAAVSGSTLSFLWRFPGHHWHLCCSTACGQHMHIRVCYITYYIYIISKTIVGKLMLIVKQFLDFEASTKCLLFIV